MDRIAALYNNVAHAQLSAERLVGMGIEPQHILLVTKEAARRYDAVKEAGKGTASEALKGALENVEIPQKQATEHREKPEQGGGLVVVQVDGDTQESVLETLQQYGVVEVSAVSGEEVEKVLLQAAPEVTGGDFWVDVEASFRRHFQAHYEPKGFSFLTYEPAYRFGYHLAREIGEEAGEWKQASRRAERAWRANELGDWNQFSEAVEQGWHLAHGRTPGREVEVSEIQTTIRGAQYRELQEEDS